VEASIQNFFSSLDLETSWTHFPIRLVCVEASTSISNPAESGILASRTKLISLSGGGCNRAHQGCARMEEPALALITRSTDFSQRLECLGFCPFVTSRTHDLRGIHDILRFDLPSSLRCLIDGILTALLTGAARKIQGRRTEGCCSLRISHSVRLLRAHLGCFGILLLHRSCCIKARNDGKG
jgi:hypothetical protein